MNALTRYTSAYRRIKTVGSQVDFVSHVKVYDETTDSYTENNTSTVTGYAVSLPGDMTEYEGLASLTLTNPRTLFFIPDVVSSLPDVDAGVVWENEELVVRAVVPYVPDGQGIGAKVVVA